jgi:DNA-binding protein H-NS
MSKPDLAAMPIDEFWMIHKELTKIRSDKTCAQNRELGERLAKLNRVKFSRPENELTATRGWWRAASQVSKGSAQNTVIPSLHRKTWVGTGKQPRRLVAGLKTGRKLDELEIGNIEKRTRKNRTGRSQHT